MSLKADDGSDLPIKEGIVLDENETMVLFSGTARDESVDDKNPRGFKVYQTSLFGKWPVIFMIAGICILTLTLGTFVFGIFLIVFLAISIIQTILRVLNLKP